MTFLYPEPCVVPESSRMIYSWCMLLPLPCTQLTSDHTLIAVCLEGLASVHATHLCVRIQRAHTAQGDAVRRRRCQQHHSSSAIAVSFPAAAAAEQQQCRCRMLRVRSRARAEGACGASVCPAAWQRLAATSATLFSPSHSNLRARSSGSVAQHTTA